MRQTSLQLAPGEIVLRDATRTFSVRADQARTLKGMLVGRRVRGPEPVHALREVSLRIAPGETVGMVGRNGAGKTSMLRVLAGIVPLQAGAGGCGGRVVSLLELGAGFSRDFSGRENIYLQGALYGFDRAQIEERVERIVGFSEIGSFIDVPVKTYSAGMFLRLGFSIASHLDADVLLIDEVLAVGDESFQRKCLRRISEQIAAGTTLLLVSHELAAIERVCERVVVFDAGRVVFDGPTSEALLHYRQMTGTEHGGGESHRPHALREVEVTDLELQDGAGHPATVFRGGSPLAVQIGLRTRARVGRARVALELRSLEGSCLYRSSFDAELGSEGTALLSFEIEELALLGGDYDLAAGAGPEGSEPAPERTARLSVAREPGPEGVVDLRGTWRAAAVTR